MTKVDIMDEGTDVCDYLNGEIYKLEHGYTAVKCRSQEDNEKKKTISQALEEEKRYFEAHPAYSKLAEDQGIPTLAKKLSELLEKHIIIQLPKIDELVRKKYDKYNARLTLLGGSQLSNDETDPFTFIVKAIDEFMSKFKESVSRASKDETEKSGEFIGGRKIYQYFKHFSENEIDSIDPFDNITDQMIIEEIQNSHGLYPSLFIPEEACRKLIKSQIHLFKKPVAKLTKKVLKSLIYVVKNILSNMLIGKHNLSKLFLEVMFELFSDNYKDLSEFVHNRIESEYSYINYNHDDFAQLKECITSDRDYSNFDFKFLGGSYNLNIDLFKNSKYQQFKNSMHSE